MCEEPALDRAHGPVWSGLRGVSPRAAADDAVLSCQRGSRLLSYAPITSSATGVKTGPHDKSANGATSLTFHQTRPQLWCMSTQNTRLSSPPGSARKY